MSTGWKLVATLGTQGAGYPHILVDKHGWCLRLGPSSRQDEKFYSNFSNLLQGLVEHFLRRRMKSSEVIESVHALVRAVEEALRRAGDLSTTAKETVIHEHIRRCPALGAGEPRPEKPTMAAHVPSPDTQERLEALAAP